MIKNTKSLYFLDRDKKTRTDQTARVGMFVCSFSVKIWPGKVISHQGYCPYKAVVRLLLIHCLLLFPLFMDLHSAYQIAFNTLLTDLRRFDVSDFNIYL